MEVHVSRFCFTSLHPFYMSFTSEWQNRLFSRSNILNTKRYCQQQYWNYCYFLFPCKLSFSSCTHFQLQLVEHDDGTLQTIQNQMKHLLLPSDRCQKQHVSRDPVCQTSSNFVVSKRSVIFHVFLGAPELLFQSWVHISVHVCLSS